MRKLGIAALVSAAVVLLIASTGLAASPYPDPPPDFSHPGTVHNNYYGTQAGQADTPMLVILRGFTDLALPTGFDEAWASTTFFGGAFPSMADYFNDNSFGDKLLTPAAETCGTTNNGVAVVTTGTRANYDTLSEPARNRSSVDAVDGCVNFAVFDSNSDGTITDLELVIMNVTAPTGPTENCGATRGIGGGTIDGKSFISYYRVGMGTTATNLMTHIHEMAHVALDMRDLYGFGVGSLDISGPTCGAPNNFYMNASAWQKMHWGWIAPTVVRNDGYYLVDRADQTGEAFILYDYARGVNDYFIVENRQRAAGTYDLSASDSGLVIWRIDETQYNSSSESVRPIDIMRPDGATNGGCTPGPGCYGGSNGDAWDPSDGATPQRTMSRTWRDGTASNVAVRAIGPNGDAIRAYFDVRGPGVLVDPTNPNGTPRQFDVTPEEANPVSFTVMNTGEATDTFNFTVTGLPAGWSATTDTQSLGAGAGSTANVAITVPADAATGVYTVTARGVSTTDGSVVTESSFTVRVVLHQTAIAYTGATSVPWGESAGFQVQLSDITDPSEIVDGVTVTFTLSDGVHTLSATAISNSTGLATANPMLFAFPGNYTLTIAVARHGKHDAASTSVGYTIEKRPTYVDYDGDLLAEYSDPANLSATLADGINGAPLAGMTVNFVLGTQAASGVTDGSGVATAVIVITQPSGSVSVTASFNEDGLYLGSSDIAAFTIDKEDLTFIYTGDTLVSMAMTPTLRSQATEETDGSPGDLSLAAATFHLAPTLTLVPFDYTTSVDAAGLSGTPATGLPVDLWTVTITVPVSNLYWEGASILPAELVVFDPDGDVTAGAKGIDINGNQTNLEMTGRYFGTTPRGNVRFGSSAGRFTSTSFRWIVVVGNQAILEVDGAVGGVARTLRLRVVDGGEPAAALDSYQAQLKSSTGTTVYTSGLVPVAWGNLQVRS